MRHVTSGIEYTCDRNLLTGFQATEDLADPVMDGVPGEPKDLHALLANLVTNALDACAATEADQQYRVLVRLCREQEEAVIEVSDNGPGIAPEDVERVFDPFFTTKEPGRGTGLGLAICARLVEGMGGQIEAGEAEGGGARFVIRLPGIDDPDSTTVVSARKDATEAP